MAVPLCVCVIVKYQTYWSHLGYIMLFSPEYVLVAQRAISTTTERVGTGFADLTLPPPSERQIPSSVAQSLEQRGIVVDCYT